MTARGASIVVTTLCCLLPLATSAWAVQGWYLMTPPVGARGESGEPAAKVPLSEWARAGAYDSAQACEAAKIEAVTATRNMYAKMREENPRKATDYARRNFRNDTTTWLDARCVNSDDPRLRP